MKISICSFLNQYIHIYISSWNSITNFTIAPRVYLMRLWGNFSAVSGLIDNFSSRLLSLVQLKRRRKIFFITLDKESASFLNLICELYLWTVFSTTLPVLFIKFLQYSSNKYKSRIYWFFEPYLWTVFVNCIRQYK